MTPQELTAWGKLYMIRLNGRLRRERLQQEHTALRRVEEASALQGERMRWAITRLQKRLGKPIDPQAYQRRQRYVVETAGLVLDGRVPAWRQHAAAFCRAQGITVRETAAYVNAYAWPGQRTIESSPIVSAFSLATRWHEHGHMVHPCEPTHRRVKKADGTGTVCLACEIRAWRFAQTHAPVWETDMHANMVQALASYAPYATASERVTLRAMTTSRSFYEVRLTRVTAHGGGH